MEDQRAVTIRQIAELQKRPPDCRNFMSRRVGMTIEDFSEEINTPQLRELLSTLPPTMEEQQQTKSTSTSKDKNNKNKKADNNSGKTHVFSVEDNFAPKRFVATNPDTVVVVPVPNSDTTAEDKAEDKTENSDKKKLVRITAVCDREEVKTEPIPLEKLKEITKFFTSKGLLAAPDDFDKERNILQITAQNTGEHQCVLIKKCQENGDVVVSMEDFEDGRNSFTSLLYYNKCGEIFWIEDFWRKWSWVAFDASWEEFSVKM